jgi:3-oxoacyl-[acyl-carrier protein] reductase
MNLHSKTIVVTGAGRGIGRTMAIQFAKRGANLALLDLNKDDLELTRSACLALEVRAFTYVVDVSSELQVSATFDEIAKELGRVDVIINNAGIIKDTLLIRVKDGKVVGKMSADQWQAVINVNLTGVFLCGREAAQKMIENGAGGVIINVSSVSRHGNTGQSNYSAAKAGVVALTVTWAKELARYGIRVGAVAPGFTGTELLGAMRPEILEKVIGAVPLRRLGKPEEIAHAAQFIAENDFFTGRCIDLDGGTRM